MKKFIHTSLALLVLLALPALAIHTSSASEKQTKTGTGTSAILNQLEGNLVVATANGFEPYALNTGDDGPKYFVFYFTANWCVPCRQFTPHLVDFYQKARRAGLDDFEIIQVSHDYSEKDLLTYMQEDKMPWPAVTYDQIGALPIFQGTETFPVPYLLAFDRKGKIVAQPWDNGRFVGPAHVIQQLTKLIEPAATDT